MDNLLFDVCVYEYLSYTNSETRDIMSNMINEDFFIIQDKVYDVFKLIYTDKIVGFICGNYLYNDSETIFVMEIGYILPDYRGKGLFFNELLFFENYFDNLTIWLYLPNRFCIKSLYSKGLLFKLNDNILFSPYFYLFFGNEEKIKGGRLYDLRYSCIVDLVNLEVSPLLDVDAEFFKGNRSMDIDYFDEIKYVLDCCKLDILCKLVIF